jgi:hypothetical protein
MHGLPEAFREVAARLPIVQRILCAAKRYIEEGDVEEDPWMGAKDLIKDCEEKTTKLKAIFQKVIPTDDAPRMKRYLSAVRTVGEGSRVETLMIKMLEDVQLLAINQGMPDAQQREVAKAIKDVSALQSSIPMYAIQEPAFADINSGTGPETNYNPPADQHNHFSGRKIYDA